MPVYLSPLTHRSALYFYIGIPSLTLSNIEQASIPQNEHLTHGIRLRRIVHAHHQRCLRGFSARYKYYSSVTSS
ncbi:hypothetical protein BAUCODRAFT_34582 [Baudoinia panamericana UAMH 10762]|uniref:Uncharacterized protein n=1 Tax=Baudoinia panamericana (strain UAMH 10762) TaxID=717646 RepID=M2MW84_BAUPA|nr:uncharacterized protein BAUCODRAFT_34582 [Baudoinia panamericana UAMH 10762]EMC95813.1 hypothetical protein BAUCODRAFT_34582 [Baudoinia panamericana UAMH 10762]